MAKGSDIVKFLEKRFVLLVENLDNFIMKKSFMAALWVLDTLKLFFTVEKVKVKTGSDKTSQDICGKVHYTSSSVRNKGLVDLICETVKHGKEEGQNPKRSPAEKGSFLFYIPGGKEGKKGVCPQVHEFIIMGKQRG